MIETSTKKHFTRVQNGLLKIYSKRKVSEIIRKRVAEGFLPATFIECLEHRITTKEARIRFNSDIALKNFIYRRDGHKCKQCGSSDRLQIHHIVSLIQNPERWNDVSNLVLVCNDHHKELHK